MDTIILIIAVVVIVGVAVFIIERRLRSHLAGPERDTGLLLLNQNVQGMQARLDETSKAISSRLDRAAEVIQGVNLELGKVKEIGRSMKDLQDFLRSPKLRGNIGEQVMKDLLEQYFPRAHFDTQFQFQSGERVDAILKTDKGIIPIDAKFPMENFQKMMQLTTESEVAEARRDFEVARSLDAAVRRIVESVG